MQRLRNTQATPSDYSANRPPRFRVGDLVIDPQDGKPARISMVLYNPDCWDGWQYAIPGCMAESFSRLSKSQRRG